ncbi:uncharacterized protein NP_3546A [Natronomonas pharaonis DSM 2160]|uniref:Uncharacterized protein n=1 Tax=Natronomonas pharaonis (strain ATCC 35678 / DSM 2160 / CIP 103997 / JCM 8858 / NBRC 14720 / NCIMB 2260 / Gabara) TaxID=348780 RepID=A0A1U7EXE7_NATPD|nr:hypothetical protein [Natronomonas pharaonis]CAI49864.1 uncharacterized protein NP_3546A [Natronomonas pharaonis DSM 2160]
MDEKQSTTGTVVYDLKRRQHAVTTGIAGLLVGGSAAAAAGGGSIQQLTLAMFVAVFVGSGLYWLLRRGTAAVTGGSSRYHVRLPAATGDRHTEGDSMSDRSSAPMEGR